LVSKYNELVLVEKCQALSSQNERFIIQADESMAEIQSLRQDLATANSKLVVIQLKC
jgi:hypothetical protein